MKQTLLNEIKRRLPKRHTDFTYHEDEDTVDLVFNSPNLPIKNNGASFESWVLFIHERSMKTKIRMGIAPQPTPIYDNLHFKRFLYRVAKFSDMGYSWFSITKELENFSQKFMEDYYSRLKVIRLPHSETGNTTGKGEGMLQRKFSAQDSILHALPECGDANLNINFPMDLFWGEKRACIRPENRVFPSAASNLDLWCIRDNTLSIFNLSCQHTDVSIVSELFFYANWCYDVFVNSKENNIIFPRKPSKCWRAFDAFFDEQNDRKPLESINACFLSDRYNPGIRVDFICEMLSSPKIHFHMLKYSCDIPLAFETDYNTPTE